MQVIKQVCSRVAVIENGGVVAGQCTRPVYKAGAEITKGLLAVWMQPFGGHIQTA